MASPQRFILGGVQNLDRNSELFTLTDLRPDYPFLMIPNIAISNFLNGNIPYGIAPILPPPSMLQQLALEISFYTIDDWTLLIKENEFTFDVAYLQLAIFTEEPVDNPIFTPDPRPNSRYSFYQQKGDISQINGLTDFVGVFERFLATYERWVIIFGSVNNVEPADLDTRLQFRCLSIRKLQAPGLTPIEWATFSPETIVVYGTLINYNDALKELLLFVKDYLHTTPNIFVQCQGLGCSDLAFCSWPCERCTFGQKCISDVCLSGPPNICEPFYECGAELTINNNPIRICPGICPEGQSCVKSNEKYKCVQNEPELYQLAEFWLLVWVVVIFVTVTSLYLGDYIYRTYIYYEEAPNPIAEYLTA